MKNNIEDFLQELNELIKKYESRKDNYGYIADVVSHNKEMLKRMTGRTTRLVDSYIQDLFANIDKYITVEDHHPHYVTNKELAYRIKNRLEREHNIKNLIIDQGGATVRLRLPETPRAEKLFRTRDNAITTDVNKAYGLNINDNKDGNEI